MTVEEKLVDWICNNMRLQILRERKINLESVHHILQLMWIMQD